MNREELSAKEFCDLLTKGKLPQSFLVNEIVQLRKELNFPKIFDGRFLKELFICDGTSNGLKFHKCEFVEAIYLQKRKFDGHLEFTECNVQKLIILHSEVKGNFIFSKNKISDFSIYNSSYEEAFIDDYGVARILSLSKQGIFIDLKDIPL